MKKQKGILLSLILCMIFIVCCCGSPAQKEEMASSGTDTQGISSAVDANGNTEINDPDNGEEISGGIPDALPQDGDRCVLTGTVSTISYDEAVELQGYPDYNAADTGQTWVIVRLDSPQRLQGSQDVSTWEREYSVVLVWTRMSSGMEFGEDTLADYIGKHIVFSAGSFNLASDTSVPIGVPWAHDIHVLEVKD